MKFNVDYSKLKGERAQEKMAEALEVMDSVVNSDQFREEFLDVIRLYKGINGLQGELSSYRTADPFTVFTLIMSGAEVLFPETDGEMDLFIDSYYSWKNVVGYTYKNTPWIWVNRKFFDTNNAIKIGSNIIHEWGHKMGFSHSRRPKHDDNYCYLLNTIYEKVALEMFPKYRRASPARKCNWWRRLTRRCK